MEMNSIKIANSLTRKWQTAMALLQHPVSCMLARAQNLAQLVRTNGREKWESPSVRLQKEKGDNWGISSIFARRTYEFHTNVQVRILSARNAVISLSFRVYIRYFNAGNMNHSFLKRCTSCRKLYLHSSCAQNTFFISIIFNIYRWN